LIITVHDDAEGFDLPQRGRSTGLSFNCCRERGAVFIGFYKRFQRAKRGWHVFPFAILGGCTVSI
jgi:hypothetical protein